MIALIAALAGACGDEQHVPAGHDAFAGCAGDPRADEYVAKMERTGEQGTSVVLVESTPAPPARFENSWHIRVLDSAGMPMEGAVMSVALFMPDHGHGTTRDTEIMPVDAPGEFMLAPVYLFMPGLWEVRITVTDAAGSPDEVIFRICIDG